MVAPVSSINQYQPDPRELEIIRRLQSLGVAPTGNLSVDKQRLQKAELEKRQQTLATNSTVNLNSLQGTGNDFSSALNNLQSIQQTQQVKGISDTSSNQLLGTVQNVNYTANITNQHNAEKMIGASQLAELNKLRLGLIA